MAGFLSYGHAYGLLQHDFVREYLLTLYSLMAHQYTRGTWTAPETRNVDPKQFAAPYCTPAQLVVPLMTRWMLVFEEPASQRLWLAKGAPRNWFEDGKYISVSNAPTRWGKVGFVIQSQINTGQIRLQVTLPSKAPEGGIKIRLRLPDGQRLGSVTWDAKAWNQFDPEQETITLPEASKRRIELVVHCSPARKD